MLNFNCCMDSGSLFRFFQQKKDTPVPSKAEGYQTLAIKLYTAESRHAVFVSKELQSQ